MVEILIRKKYTALDHAERVKAQGRRLGKPIGSHIIDLVDLKKAIVLCPNCQFGFNPKFHKYHKWTKTTFIMGECDACKQYANQAFMFIPDNQY